MSCNCNKKVVLLNDVTTSNIWLNGAGVPAAILGNDGDYYLDDSTGDYYNKVTGAWVLQGNIEGPVGPAGGGATEQGVFLEVPVLGDITNILNVTGNVVAATGVGGYYSYYAVGRLLVVTYNIEITLDGVIGTPQRTTIDINIVPTPGNLSTAINSADLRGTAAIEGAETGAFTNQGTAVATLQAVGGTTVKWTADGGTLSAITDLLLLKGQMHFILD